MTRSTTALIALVVVTACGGTSPTPIVATASNVAVQTSDLPAGMVRCNLSGDIDAYVNNIKTEDPTTYTSTKSQWEAAQAKGATAAQVVFYTDSAANCASVESKVSNISSASYKLVVNFVIQFKDEATAATDYTNEKIFDFDRTALGANGAPVVEGTKTGLGPNSIVLSVPIASQSFYIAVWQAKAFMVILGIINFDSATGQKVADAEYKRIH
jgi:hypothetical protein